MKSSMGRRPAWRCTAAMVGGSRRRKMPSMTSPSPVRVSIDCAQPGTRQSTLRSEKEGRRRRARPRGPLLWAAGSTFGRQVCRPSFLPRGGIPAGHFRIFPLCVQQINVTDNVGSATVQWTVTSVTRPLRPLHAVGWLVGPFLWPAGEVSFCIGVGRNLSLHPLVSWGKRKRGQDEDDQL
jgi:hypothetical protein